MAYAQNATDLFRRAPTLSVLDFADILLGNTVSGEVPFVLNMAARILIFPGSADNFGLAQVVDLPGSAVLHHKLVRSFVPSEDLVATLQFVD